MSKLAHLNTMAAWLYRPLLDLGEMPAWRTLSTNTVEFAHRRMADDVDLPELMAGHTAELRAEVVRAVGPPEYAVSGRACCPPSCTHSGGRICVSISIAGTTSLHALNSGSRSF